MIGRIGRVISMVSKVFSEIGGSANEGTSLTKLIFGGDFKKSDTEEGINAVMKSGRALKSVATGLKDFDSYTSELDFSDSENSITRKITNVITTISQICLVLIYMKPM